VSLAKHIAKYLAGFSARPLTDPGIGGGGEAWSPLQYFAASEQGIWLDPSDFTRYMADKGPELSQDLSFDDTSKWNKGGGWSVSGGQAVHNGSVADYINSLFNAIPGKVYEYVIDIAAIPASSNVIIYCNGAAGPVYTSAGVYKTAVFCTAVGKHSIRASNTTGGTTIINSFSIKEVTSASTATLFEDPTGNIVVARPEQPIGMALDKRLGLVPGANVVTNGDFSSGTGWTLGGSWVISGGVLTATAVGSGTTASRTGDVVAGKWYKATVVINSITGGSGVKVSIGSTDSTTITGAGTYCFILRATNTNVSLQAQGTSTFVIDSITAQELPGNHATQATAGKKPKLSLRKNLVTSSEALGTSYFGGTTVGCTTADNISRPMGTGRVVRRTTGSSSYAYASASMVASGVYTVSCYVRRSDRAALVFGTPGNASATNNDCTLVVNGASVAPSTLTVTAAGAGWWRVSVPFTFTSGQCGPISYNTSAELDWTGVQVEAAAAVSTYQSSTLANIYATTGFFPYFAFDGVDDNLATGGTVDFTGTDAMTIVSGIQKTTNTSARDICSLGATPYVSDGTFTLSAPGSAAPSLLYASRGTAGSSNNVDNATYTAPWTGVFTGQSDISADQLIGRANGVQVFTAATDQGTGNYINDVLYIGGRAGTSAFYLGGLFQLIVRGANTTAPDLTSGETFVAAKTGVTL
jgi:hypothetical protein